MVTRVQIWICIFISKGSVFMVPRKLLPTTLYSSFQNGCLSHFQFQMRPSAYERSLCYTVKDFTLVEKEGKKSTYNYIVCLCDCVISIGWLFLETENVWADAKRWVSVGFAKTKVLNCSFLLQGQYIIISSELASVVKLWETKSHAVWHREPSLSCQHSYSVQSRTP